MISGKHISLIGIFCLSRAPAATAQPRFRGNWRDNVSSIRVF